MMDARSAEGLKALLEIGWNHFDKGHFAEALEAYNVAVQRNPANPHCYHLRGQCYLMQGLYTEAMAEFTHAIQINPRCAGDYYGRGDCFRHQGQLADAMQEYSKALKLDPRFAGAYWGRGDCLLAQGRFDEGITEFTSALRADPQYERAYFGRAECFRCKGMPHEAELDAEKALELDPSGLDTRQLLNKLLQDKQRVSNQITGRAEAARTQTISERQGYNVFQPASSVIEDEYAGQQQFFQRQQQESIPGHTHLQGLQQSGYTKQVVPVAMQYQLPFAVQSQPQNQQPVGSQYAAPGVDTPKTWAQPNLSAANKMQHQASSQNVVTQQSAADLTQLSQKMHTTSATHAPPQRNTAQSTTTLPRGSQAGSQKAAAIKSCASDSEEDDPAHWSEQDKQSLQEIEIALKNGNLSGEELKKLKKQRRAMRNRASATASRQRKKHYLQNLEQELADLQSLQGRLQIRETRLKVVQTTRDKQLQLLREENQQLQNDHARASEENAALKDTVAQHEKTMRRKRAVKLGDQGSAHAAMDMNALGDCHALSSSWPPADCVPQYVLFGMAEIQKYHEKQEGQRSSIEGLYERERVIHAAVESTAATLAAAEAQCT
jgi:tetratricopeptide (TPR) repeat protein